MASPRYQPVGQIDVGTTNATSGAFMLVSVINNISYVATLFNENNVLFLPIFNQSGNSINPNVSHSNIIQFNAFGSLDKLAITFFFPSKGSRLLTDSSTPPGIFAGTDLTPNPFLAFSSPYKVPPPPGILWSGAIYTINNLREQQAVIRYETSPGTIVNSPALVIPVSLNYVITIDGSESTRSCSTNVNNVISSLEVFACSQCRVNNLSCVNGSICAKVPQTTWTNHLDCSNNIEYIYCDSNIFCGEDTTQNCYAACRSGGQCKYSIVQENYTCGTIPFPPNPPLTPGSGRDPALITPVASSSTGLIIGAVIIIIIIIIIIAVFHHHSENHNLHHHSYTHPNYIHNY